jgi:hypothetical protein
MLFLNKSSSNKIKKKKKRVNVREDMGSFLLHNPCIDSVRNRSAETGKFHNYNKVQRSGTHSHQVKVKFHGSMTFHTLPSSSLSMVIFHQNLIGRHGWCLVTYTHPQHSGLFVMVAENCFLEAKSSQEASMFGLERGCEAQ